MTSAATSEILRNQEKPQSCFSHLHPQLERDFQHHSKTRKGGGSDWGFLLGHTFSQKEESVLLARKRG